MQATTCLTLANAAPPAARLTLATLGGARYTLNRYWGTVSKFDARRGCVVVHYDDPDAAGAIESGWLDAADPALVWARDAPPDTPASPDPVPLSTAQQAGGGSEDGAAAANGGAGCDSDEEDLTKAVDPEGLMHKRVKVFWPRDRQWFLGRITAYDKKSGKHHVQYDDGDRRWYRMRTREYRVLKEYGRELVGRRVSLQLGRRRQEWFCAEVVQYDSDRGAHQVRFDDGEADWLVIGDVAHFVLEQARTLDANQPFLGRRLWVFWVRELQLYSGTIVRVEVCPPSRRKEVADVIRKPKAPSFEEPPAGSAEADAALAGGGDPAARPNVHDDIWTKIAYDDGDASIKNLRDLQFAWADERTRGTPIARGAVGLRNMGNTCYLNATLQCLAHVNSLVEFSHRPNVAEFVDPRRRLGMQGRVAHAFTMLARELWSDGIRDVSPGLLKAVLAEKDSTFKGMGQEDAHELLLCLLDGLHEDLATPVADGAADAKPLAGDSKEKDGEKGSVVRSGSAVAPASSSIDKEGTADGVIPAQRDGAPAGAIKGGAGGADEPDKLSADGDREAESGAAAASGSAQRHEQATSIVRRLFFLDSQKVLTCQRCKHVRTVDGPVGGELLPPLPLAVVKRKVGFWRRSITVDAHLKDCLDHHFRMERIGKSSEWRCEGCNKVSVAHTQPYCSSLPKVLVVALKRFEYYPWPTKLHDRVVFPLHGLDMGPYATPECIAEYEASGLSSVYDLLAVTNHFGGLTHGHYTAFVRHYVDELPLWPPRLPQLRAAEARARGNGLPEGGGAADSTAAGASDAKGSKPKTSKGSGRGVLKFFARRSKKGKGKVGSGAPADDGGAAAELDAEVDAADADLPPTEAEKEDEDGRAATRRRAARRASLKRDFASEPPLTDWAGRRYRWIHFDDHIAEFVDEEEVASADTSRSAYMLFYVRRDVRGADARIDFATGLERTDSDFAAWQ